MSFRPHIQLNVLGVAPRCSLELVWVHLGTLESKLRLEVMRGDVTTFWYTNCKFRTKRSISIHFSSLVQLLRLIRILHLPQYLVAALQVLVVFQCDRHPHGRRPPPRARPVPDCSSNVTPHTQPSPPSCPPTCTRGAPPPDTGDWPPRSARGPVA
jgi:hypothetical protein